MASAPISKLEYLKKYMSPAQTEEKKHKKKKLKHVLKARSNVTIIDTDVDLKKIKSEAFDEEDENAPQIVAVISDHDKELQRKKWRTVGVSKDKVTIKEEPPSPVSDHYEEQQINRSRSSPVRRRRHDSASDSDRPPVRRRHDSASDSDRSPVRRRHDSASDADRSPARKTKPNSDTDRSPVRRRRHDSGSDSDHFPVRKPHQEATGSFRKRQSSDSDAFPPRKKSNKEADASRNGANPRKDEDSDNSPPRPNRLTVDEDGDSSPVRKSTSVLIPPHKIKKEKMDKTLDGKKAGLQSARDLRKETDALRQREDEAFKKLSENLSGRSAETVHRDRATGKRRNLEAEREANREKEERKRKLLEKFQDWGKGLKQSQAQEQRLQDDLHEMSKPLARAAGDEDLENYLKAQNREGDPMAAYMAKKKKKQEASIPGRPSRPTYQGPDGPPNRFNIPPGYRWDGVDRSNGFEKQWFTKQTKKVAVAEEAYKWSVADM